MKKPRGYQSVKVSSGPKVGTVTVDMGVRSERPVTFRSFAAAKAFLDGFEFDGLTVQLREPGLGPVIVPASL